MGTQEKIISRKTFSYVFCLITPFEMITVWKNQPENVFSTVPSNSHEIKK